jgi:hypothetical protein
MDLSSAVRTDTLPGIVTILAPGLIASAPYSWYLLAQSPDLQAVLNQHEAIAVAAAILLWSVNGLAVDSLGSYVEVYLIDRVRPNHAEMMDTWRKYLRIAWVHEPVGQHYLRRILVSFKFELNMSVAALVGAIGVILFLPDLFTSRAVALLAGSLLVLAGLLFFAARDSSTVLADVRAALVEGVGHPPFDENGNPSPLA